MISCQRKLNVVSVRIQPLICSRRKLSRVGCRIQTYICCTTICTHNGKFHCDEALACWLLKQTSKFQNAKIVRSRDEEEIQKADVVVDVGGLYSPDDLRFDHHQSTFNETFGEDFVVKLSSAGLVYKHFGREIISKIIKKPEDDKDIEITYLKIYQTFIKAIDAIDNGMNQYEGGEGPLYFDNTNLSSRVSRLNPHWLEEQSHQVSYERFLEAVELTGSEFQQSVEGYVNIQLPARKFVEEYINNRKEIDSSGEIIKLERSVPWKSFLYECEKEMKIVGEIKYCVYQDPNQNWRVQAVDVENAGFENRLSLPEAWRGKSGDELSEITGIKGCVFVHNNRFIGGNKTYEGVLEMARKSLAIAREFMKECIKNRKEIDSSGEIIKLEQSIPWKSYLYDSEKEMGIEGEIKFCLYQDSEKNWRVCAVGDENGEFENRLLLPEPWRGKSGDELLKITGIEGCIFVDEDGFVGGNLSYEGVLEMAHKALAFKES